MSAAALRARCRDTWRSFNDRRTPRGAFLGGGRSVRLRRRRPSPLLPPSATPRPCYLPWPPPRGRCSCQNRGTTERLQPICLMFARSPHAPSHPARLHTQSDDPPRAPFSPPLVAVRDEPRRRAAERSPSDAARPASRPLAGHRTLTRGPRSNPESARICARIVSEPEETSTRHGVE